MSRGVLLLTFDDFFVPEWSAAREILRRHGSRVTFFLSELDRVADWAPLRELAEDGHTVGAHGWRHLHAPDRIAAVGGPAYLREEIGPCVAGLRAEGFAPRSFAYPVSARDEGSDEVLCSVFARLRGGLSVPYDTQIAAVEEFFVPVDALAERRVLIGAGADTGKLFQPRGLGDASLLGGLRRAAERDECLTLYAHAIAGTHEANHISPERVGWLLDQAAELGLRALGFDDLSVQAPATSLTSSTLE